MTTQTPEERCLVSIDKTYFLSVKNEAGYHPGPVTPSSSDRVPLQVGIMGKDEEVSKFVAKSIVINFDPPAAVSQQMSIDQTLL